MHFAQKNLLQDVTYWAPGVENIYGQAASSAPVLIKGRWQDKIQQVIGSRGEEVTSSAMVFVDRDVAVSGFLALGDLTDQASPPAGAREIQNYSSIPDLRTLGAEKKAYL